MIPMMSLAECTTLSREKENAIFYGLYFYTDLEWIHAILYCLSMEFNTRHTESQVATRGFLRTMLSG